MASSLNFVEFVIDQIQTIYPMRYRKMFGEYFIYIDEKPAILICDDIAHVKMHAFLEPLLHDAETRFPYPKASLHYVLDIDDGDLLTQVAELLAYHLPPYIKKSRKK